MPELVEAVGLNHTAVASRAGKALPESLGVWSGDAFVNLVPALRKVCICTAARDLD